MKLYDPLKDYCLGMPQSHTSKLKEDIAVEKVADWKFIKELASVR